MSGAPRTATQPLNLKDGRKLDITDPLKDALLSTYMKGDRRRSFLIDKSIKESEYISSCYVTTRYFYTGINDDIQRLPSNIARQIISGLIKVALIRIN